MVSHVSHQDPIEGEKNCPQTIKWHFIVLDFLSGNNVNLIYITNMERLNCQMNVVMNKQ